MEPEPNRFSRPVDSASLLRHAAGRYTGICATTPRYASFVQQHCFAGEYGPGCGDKRPKLLLLRVSG